MAGKKASGENGKKASGNARKAEAAASKHAAEEAQRGHADEEEWGKGAKSTAKKDAAEAKKADAARKKAEKDALLADEARDLPAAKTGNAKTAAKKGGNAKSSSTAAPSVDAALAGLDAADATDGGLSSSSAALNASGIDNALDALTLTTTAASADTIDRHPERRFKAAYAAYEARRLPEIEAEAKGTLRKQQRIEMVRKEFERSPENPFNQVNARFDASRDELRDLKLAERRKVEERLSGGAGGGVAG
ncbi:MAG: hypothetical protein M1826_002129 [Phylliscum demangeonii]|nr:MAG: hypothetical protein M1826_002129 [Phylliscum demangeonii]